MKECPSPADPRAARPTPLPLSQQRRWHFYRRLQRVWRRGRSGSYGLTAVAFDADEDGWPDIFVACDSTPSLLLMNNHDGTFREEALMRGVALSAEGQEMGGMGVGLGDYDLDGHTRLC